MTRARDRSAFLSRPGADAWVAKPGAERAPSEFTARLTIDITPDLRRRLKLAALQRGVTVADMLRALLQERFPPSAETDT